MATKSKKVRFKGTTWWVLQEFPNGTALASKVGANYPAEVRLIKLAKTETVEPDPFEDLEQVIGDAGRAIEKGLDTAAKKATDFFNTLLGEDSARK